MPSVLYNTIQGALGNYNEVPLNVLLNEYGMYLMTNETIAVGFKLIRDALVVTNKRIIIIDKQGPTGIKAKVQYIKLYSIVDVTLETSGFGIDDTDLYITYVSSHDLKGYRVSYFTRKFEFPKQYNIQPLYLYLVETAYNNGLRTNQIVE